MSVALLYQDEEHPQWGNVQDSGFVKLICEVFNLTSQGTLQAHAVKCSDVHAVLSRQRFDCILIFGGRMEAYNDFLGSGRALLIQRIREGMGFVGICAGAFCGIGFCQELGVDLMWENWGDGYGTRNPCQVQLTQYGQQVFGLGPNIGNSKYAFGPLIDEGSLRRNASNVKVLSRFAPNQRTDPPIGRPLGGKCATAIAQVGRAKLAMVADHWLEASQLYQRVDPHGVPYHESEYSPAFIKLVAHCCGVARAPAACSPRDPVPHAPATRMPPRSQSNPPSTRAAPIVKVGNTAEPLGQNRFRWKFYVKPKKYIEAVEVTLHHTVPDSIPRVLHRPAKFEWSCEGWGTFQIMATIHWRGGGACMVPWPLQFDQSDFFGQVDVPPEVLAGANGGSGGY